jgi:hypothetical protein
MKPLHNALRAAIASTLAISLLLLLAPHGPAHYGVVLACFLSLPTLFMGMVDVPRVLGPVEEISLALPSQYLGESSLFQRPPPVAIA